MIYTCTFSPAIDYTPTVEQFTVGQLNRTKEVHYLPGGKGINVSRILTEFDCETTALGFVGGFTGVFLKQLLEAQQIRTDFIETNEVTRINVKIKSDIETELNGPSPMITTTMFEQLLNQIRQARKGDWFVLSGAVPNGFDLTQLLAIIQERELQFVADIAGQVLHEIVQYKPFLVKPNLEELGELFQVSLQTAEQAIPYAKKLQALGAMYVIVSLGGDGALLVTEEDVFYANAPKGQVVNTVGAGDSVVATTIAFYSRNVAIQEAFRYGVAAGSATAFQLDLCKKEDVIKLVNDVSIKKL